MRIETFPRGNLDIKATINYFSRLKIDTRIQQGAIEIVNFENVADFKISHSESKEITQCFQNPKAIQKIRMTIFICETELAYGIGRMLQTFHSITNPDHKVVVIRSKKEINTIINEA